MVEFYADLWSKLSQQKCLAQKIWFFIQLPEQTNEKKMRRARPAWGLMLSQCQHSWSSKFVDIYKATKACNWTLFEPIFLICSGAATAQQRLTGLILYRRSSNRCCIFLILQFPSSCKNSHAAFSPLCTSGFTSVILFTYLEPITLHLMWEHWMTVQEHK